jgi:hypothetical protein
MTAFDATGAAAAAACFVFSADVTPQEEEAGGDDYG